MIPKGMKEDLLVYGRTLVEKGFPEADGLIPKFEKKWGTDFRRWAYALGVAMRAKEILGNERH